MKIYFTKQHIPLIVNGSKTQTRRPVKIPFNDNIDKFEFIESHKIWTFYSHGEYITCSVPKYKIGDILQVLETESDEYSGYNIEITGIRIEWLQDISEEDCIAEGVQFKRKRILGRCKIHYESENPTSHYVYAETSFRKTIWNKLPYKPPYDWNSNPLVWVYEFKRIGE